MSVVSRVVLAGLVCASLGSVQAIPTMARAQTAAASSADDKSRDTRGRFVHASKCVMTFGFTAGCDKDAPAPKAAPKAAEREDVTKAAIDSTRSRFFQASRCVVSLGFIGECDKDAAPGSPSASSRRADAGPAAPAGSASASSRRADAAPAPPPAAPDTSTRGRFLQASKCVTTFGFGSGCDKK